MRNSGLLIMKSCYQEHKMEKYVKPEMDVVEIHNDVVTVSSGTIVTDGNNGENIDPDGKRRYD